MDDNVPAPEAENAPVAEDSNEPTSPVDETTTSETPETEGPAEEAQIDEPAAEDTDSEPERKPNRAERRIRQLNDQLKQLSGQNQPYQGFGQSPQMPQYYEGQEVSPQQLQADVVQTAQTIAGLTVEQRIQQERAQSNAERDLEVLPSKYPELNPDSPEYNPELEKAVTEEFQERAFRVVGVDRAGKPQYQLDPSVRLADIAKRYTKVAKAAALNSGASMKNAVARTADTAALKPKASTRQDKPLSEMSEAEIEAKMKADGRYIRA